MPFLLGVVVLLLLLWAIKAFAKAGPKQAARLVRQIGGVAALLLGAFLLFRGQIAVAIPVGVFGLGLLGWVSPFWPTILRPKQRSSGQVSRVRTACLEMELDHDSGAMRGHVLAGRHEGAALDALDLGTVIGLMREIDGDSRNLLMAYLDRREPRWREHAQYDATAGNGGGAAFRGEMTEQEAYQILGLEPGAAAQEITRAHRSLIKKLHPDQGGTTYLAARINQAKEVLLRRHR
jgi:DnaJ-like protein